GIEPSERTHLLSDSVNQSPALRRCNSADITNDCAQSLPKKDEQNALSRLVQNTAMYVIEQRKINMINVSALDSHNLEHQEYTDRIKLYSQRLQQQWNNVQHPGIAQKGRKPNS
ncbi:CG14184, partial [Drosophila busckii]